MSVHEWRLLGDKTLSGIARELQALLSADSLGGRVVEAGFDSWRRELFDPESETRRVDDATWIFLLSPRVLERPRVSEELEELLALLQSLSRRIFFGTFFADSLVPRPLTNSLSPELLAARLNLRLAEFAKSRAQFFLLDQAGLVAREGLRALSDPRFEALAQMFYSPAGARSVARLVFRAVRALQRPSAKVLALDLDNTLWGGILGEDGSDGLAMGPTDRGYSYRRFQEAVLTLKREGVLLVAVSKNDSDAALEVLRTHPDCLVKPEDFAALEIHWQPKSESLRRISEKLGLGLDSFVFLDDSPNEREEMRRVLPEVTVLDFPTDPAGLVALLADTSAFDTLQVTEEDRKRTDDYRAQSQRENLRHAAPSLEEFYRSMQTRLELFRAEAGSAERLHQLVLKTNQFNLSSERLTPDTFRALMLDPAVDVWGLRVGDRLGDSGVTGLAIVRKSADVWRVENFLLSCRVIGRTVEFGFLRWLTERARAGGTQSLDFVFRATSKNRVAREFLEKSTLVANADQVSWRVDLTTDALAGLPPPFCGDIRGSRDMTFNDTLFRQTVERALRLPAGRYRDELKLGDVAEWDSLGHLDLVIALEQAFGVSFPTALIPQLDSLVVIRQEIMRLSPE